MVTRAFAHIKRITVYSTSGGLLGITYDLNVGNTDGSPAEYDESDRIVYVAPDLTPRQIVDAVVSDAITVAGNHSHTVAAHDVIVTSIERG